MDLDRLLNHPHATFHDADLERVEIGNEAGKANLIFRICIGNPHVKEIKTGKSNAPDGSSIPVPSPV